MIPQSYVYLAKMRATRDLLRRRNHLMRKRAELFAHIQNTRSKYNLPDHLGRIAKPKNREGVVERFEDPSVIRKLLILTKHNMVCINTHYGEPENY